MASIRLGLVGLLYLVGCQPANLERAPDIPVYTGGLSPITSAVLIRHSPYPKTASTTRTTVTATAGGRQTKELTTQYGEVEAVAQGDGVRFTVDLLRTVSDKGGKVEVKHHDMTFQMVVSKYGELIDIQSPTGRTAMEKAVVQLIRNTLVGRALLRLPADGVKSGSVINSEIKLPLGRSAGVGVAVTQTVVGATKFKKRRCVVFEINGDASVHTSKISINDLRIRGYSIMDQSTAAVILTKMIMIGNANINGTSIYIRSLMESRVDTSAW